LKRRPARIDRKFRDRAGHECGAIPSNMIAVAVDGHKKEEPTFSRIHPPANLDLNGECTDANGHHIEANNLVAW
jgi:hypothetical protein